MSVSLDLTGQKYGMLTALRRVENVKGRTAWLCRCECGNELVVLTKYLQGGQKNNCGCRKHGVEALHYVDGTCIEMLQSNTIRSNNRSGATGVYYNRQRNRWRATIMLQGKRIYLGSYVSFTDAVQARADAKETLHNDFVTKYLMNNEGQSNV